MVVEWRRDAVPCDRACSGFTAVPSMTLSDILTGTVWGKFFTRVPRILDLLDHDGRCI